MEKFRFISINDFFRLSDFLMSILLSSIDCPCLTNDDVNKLFKQFSIFTTNDFALWSINDQHEKKDLSFHTIECIRSCIIAHTSIIQNRPISEIYSYRLNYFLFDNENYLRNQRHLIFIYEYFNQNQWNQFFNIFLIRLFLANESIKIHYINTNISLFDINYFYSYYCCLNEKICSRRKHLFENHFLFNQCFHLETFENQLQLIENDKECCHVLIIDDLFSLIKPYLGLDRRIKGKVLQLTYRLNRLAQKQSLLIINGIISNTKQRIKHFEANEPVIHDIRFDSFHADQYFLFQSLTRIENEIHVTNLNKKLDLDDWRNLKNSEFL